MADKLKIHEERLEQLMEYYAGDVAGEARAELEAHLEGCQECQTTLKQAKEVLPFAEAYLAFKPKRTIDEQVARFEAMWAERDRVKEREPRRWGLWLGLALGAATAVVVAIAWLRQGSVVHPGQEIYAPQRAKDGG
jgi:predicted anti-sigma-YlaC factor YlaD